MARGAGVCVSERETIKSWMPRTSGGLGHREGRAVGRIGGRDGLDPVGQLAQRSGVVFLLSSLVRDQVFHALPMYTIRLYLICSI